jgi:hypothetical protein
LLGCENRACASTSSVTWSRADPGVVAVEPDPDTMLADLGAELAARVSAAVPGWVVRCVDGLLPPAQPDRDRVMVAAEAAGERAGAQVASDLRVLLTADVDAQRSTPLEVVRAAVVFPTEVLADAHVSPGPRDRFAAERFPDDPYGLSPASLPALDPALGELAIAWGAAKALAHRHRHRSH